MKPHICIRSESIPHWTVLRLNAHNVRKCSLRHLKFSDVQGAESCKMSHSCNSIHKQHHFWNLQRGSTLTSVWIKVSEETACVTWNKEYGIAVCLTITVSKSVKLLVISRPSLQETFQTDRQTVSQTWDVTSAPLCTLTIMTGDQQTFAPQTVRRYGIIKLGDGQLIPWYSSYPRVFFEEIWKWLWRTLVLCVEIAQQYTRDRTCYLFRVFLRFKNQWKWSQKGSLGVKSGIILSNIEPLWDLEKIKSQSTAFVRLFDTQTNTSEW